MNPWYKVVTLREEVREGRSFSPDEFAIALEQVIAGTAPADYRNPDQFFSRTCFTRALKEHAGMVLRRLAAHELAPEAWRRICNRFLMTSGWVAKYESRSREWQ